MSTRPPTVSPGKKDVTSSFSTQHKMQSVREVSYYWRISPNDAYAARDRDEDPMPHDERGYIYSDLMPEWYMRNYGVIA